MIRIFPAGQRGFSLIELIIAITIIGTAVVGVVSMMTFLVARSPDPMWQEQATLIGEAYMSEIILKPFIDPSKKIKDVCPPLEAGGRSVYDNVCDYRGPDDPLQPGVMFPMVDVGVRDQVSNVVDGLEAYTVTVIVTGDNSVTLGPASTATYPNLQITNDVLADVIQVLKVEVRVQGPESTDLTFTGYRTHYNCSFADKKRCKPLKLPI